MIVKGCLMVVMLVSAAAATECYECRQEVCRLFILLNRSRDYNIIRRIY